MNNELKKSLRLLHRVRNLLMLNNNFLCFILLSMDTFIAVKNILSSFSDTWYTLRYFKSHFFILFISGFLNTLKNEHEI